MDEQYDWSWKPATHGRIHQRGDEDWIDGIVVTPLGYVTAYADSRMTCMRFIWRGREHARTIKRTRPTDRGLAVLAGKFAREIAARPSDSGEGA